MGAGALTAGKISELQEMEKDAAIRILEQAGVAPTDATTVIERVRKLSAASLVDGETIANLVEGLAPHAQDALVALTTRSPRSSPFKSRPSSSSQRVSFSRPGSQSSSGAGGALPLEDATDRQASSSSRPGRSIEEVPEDEEEDSLLCNLATLRRTGDESLCNLATLRKTEESAVFEEQCSSEDVLQPPEDSLVDHGGKPWAAAAAMVADEETNNNNNNNNNNNHKINIAVEDSTDFGKMSEVAAFTASWRPPVGVGGAFGGFELHRVHKGRWKVGKLIGTGSYGQVYQGLNLDTGSLIAIKTLILPSYSSSEQAMANRELEQIHREIELMSSLAHPNIVSYLGAEVEHDTCKLHIFQEWVPGGSLSQILRNFGGKFDDVVVVRRYLVHLLRGLVYLHEHRIVHRDIKGENILISEQGVAKLADMGASKRISADGTLNDTNSLKGTPYFMAPEQMKQKRVGRKADVWALGGVALLMATGDPPWRALEAKSPYALMIAVIQSNKGPPIDHYDLDPELRSFIDACFIRDVERRPSSETLATHRFLLTSAEDDVRSSAERDRLIHMHDIMSRPTGSRSKERPLLVTDDRPPADLLDRAPLDRPSAPDSKVRASSAGAAISSNNLDNNTTTTGKSNMSTRGGGIPLRRRAPSTVERSSSSSSTSRPRSQGLRELRSRIRATTPPKPDPLVR